MSKTLETMYTEHAALEKKLQELSDEMKKAAKNDAQRKKIVADVRKKIAVYSITPVQLFPELRKKREQRDTGKEAPARKAKGPAMYIKDGKSWTGKGRAPDWIKAIPEAERLKYKVQDTE